MLCTQRDLAGKVYKGARHNVNADAEDARQSYLHKRRTEPLSASAAGSHILIMIDKEKNALRMGISPWVVVATVMVRAFELLLTCLCLCWNIASEAKGHSTNALTPP